MAKLGRLKEAEISIRRAITLDPAFTQAREFLTAIRSQTDIRQ